MADLCSDELLQLLLCRGGADMNENPSLINLPDPPPPPSSPLPMYYAPCNPSGKEIPTPSEAEMASWLSQVFEHETHGPATATTNQYEGGNALPSSTGGASGSHRTASACVAASGDAECRSRPSSSGRRRSCSGKAAEQRRRNKINDKLRTLQQMMPWCSKVKTDKVSTLDEVIKYVKSLQNQVQVMSANGYAVPTPILPLGVMPPPLMQPRLPAGDVLGVAGQAPVIFPQYPVFPTVYACLHHGTPAPPHPRRHPVEPGPGINSGGRQQQLAPRRV